jgi:hypothetical protein
VFARLPLRAWGEYANLLRGQAWPGVDGLNARLPAGCAYRFAAQTPDLLADGLHYEQRIAERGLIATREGNWHDLLNAVIWLRHPELKLALNAMQVAEVARMGPKRRSRAQYALTQFDESGVLVLVRDPGLLTVWDTHDWYELFWTGRAAWRDSTIEVAVFGHALLELALTPARLLVGRALPFLAPAGVGMRTAFEVCAAGVADGRLLRDPQDLRPLPLSGIPGWCEENSHAAFHRTAACYQPLRPGRRYPPATRIL